ncbi:G patch domain-containing protein 4 isoform X2 [Pelobates fuscus]|uniref:G patch domain-containing protein 4 isoform X2 n=1 Tax=Pelobates fuscus TaxID=191477 RepID=UPI002FE4877C
MSTPSAPKSQGMRFAEEQLQKHGWTEGKGLGKRESGISEAIKVKVKCDKAGVGHDSAEQFTFHWWDHVFNKTAASISVEADQGGVQVKKLKEEESIVTNKKPRKALANSNMLYGRFVKSATLLSGGEKPVEKSSSSESSDSEDEDEKLDLSSTTKMTDEDLIKVCGGRTAHKGARHGLTMSAKLSRLEEQERAFLEKYGKKGQKNIEAPAEDNSGSSKKHLQEQANDTTSTASEPAVPKKKKRKNTGKHGGLNGHDEEVEPCADQDGNGTKRNKKSKKSHRKESPSPEEQAEQDGESMDSHVKSMKKKKKKQKKYAE